MQLHEKPPQGFPGSNCDVAGERWEECVLGPASKSGDVRFVKFLRTYLMLTVRGEIVRDFTIALKSGRSVL
jgi:hypothetical protein